MSIATLDPAIRASTRAIHAVDRTTRAPEPSTVPPTPRRLQAVPEGTEARGFALYVGLDEVKAIQAGTSLAQVVERLKEVIDELVPSAETHASVALAPQSAGGRDVDVVRLALRDPATLAARAAQQEPLQKPSAAVGVVVDVSRKRALIDGVNAALTFKEFELLQYLVLREGKTIERGEIVSALWTSTDDDLPNERTIDVHVRRLRAKLGGFEEIVRTVRGVGYRFDRHPDVSIRYASTPSPDIF